MLCAFKTTPLADGMFLHQCKRETCDRKMTTANPNPPGATCRGVHEARRAFNFTVASIKHVLRLAPTCTQDQIDARLVICRQCPLYRRSGSDPNLGYCAHKSCGCSITNMKGFLNKLGWAEQSCPEGKWHALPGSPQK